MVQLCVCKSFVVVMLIAHDLDFSSDLEEESSSASSFMLACRGCGIVF